MSDKVCTICKLSKPVEEFYELPQYSKKGKKWNCRDSMCRPCRLSYTTERRRKIKRQVIEYLGGKCKDCGVVDDPVIYDCHHLDSTQKELSFGKINKRFDLLKDELNKCVLLCASCHRKRHKADAIISDSSSHILT